MMRRTLFALVTGVALGSCAEASGELRGSTPSADLVNEQDTTPPEYVGCDATETIDAGAGTKWSDLYRDLFGPSSSARCANAQCHGSPSGAGTQAVPRLKCFDEKGCRQGFFDYGLVDPATDPFDPTGASIFTVIRHCNAERKTQADLMPKTPRNYYFSQASIERIQIWIRDGAKDD